MALILARKEGESIWIGDDIRLFVKKINGTRVLIWIDAPQAVQVYRGEIRHLLGQKPQGEKKQA